MMHKYRYTARNDPYMHAEVDAEWEPERRMQGIGLWTWRVRQVQAMATDAAGRRIALLDGDGTLRVFFPPYDPGPGVCTKSGSVYGMVGLRAHPSRATVLPNGCRPLARCRTGSTASQTSRMPHVGRLVRAIYNATEQPREGVPL